jgi:tRNA dimethylallyltransferase
MNKLIVIAGPTASGKSAAAIELAKYYNTVIVSADSRQFYREMSIGTAKPSRDELAEIKHYFINSLSITDIFTAGDYEKRCLALLNDLFQVHEVVVLVGGSGLFIKAVCEGFDDFPDPVPGLRERLNKELEDNGIAYLQEKLQISDPEYYEVVDLNNPQRVIRALEVSESTGKPFSSYHKSPPNKRPFRIIKFGLNLPRADLYQRINHRVNTMVQQGLVNEAKSLLPHRRLNALNTVGYSELFEYFDGKINLTDAVELIKQNTRRFAKRQMTWFGKDDEILWLEADKPSLVNDMVSEIDAITE